MNPVLDGRSLQQKVDDAIELLREQGYLVRGPLLSRTNVKTPAQLVRFFYDTLSRYRPDRQYGHAGSKQRDRAIAKQFIEARKSTGVSKARALQECCDLIELLFEHEPLLHLSRPITSMGVLGQDRLGWITERLVGIKEGLDNEAAAAEDALYFERLSRKQENVVDTERLSKARKRMDKVLERYAEESKKEGSND